MHDSSGPLGVMHSDISWTKSLNRSHLFPALRLDVESICFFYFSACESQLGGFVDTFVATMAEATAEG